MLTRKFEQNSDGRITQYLILIILLFIPFIQFVSFGKAADPVRTDISVHVANDMINNNTGYPDLFILDVQLESVQWMLG